MIESNSLIFLQIEFFLLCWISSVYTKTDRLLLDFQWIISLCGIMNIKSYKYEKFVIWYLNTPFHKDKGAFCGTVNCVQFWNSLSAIAENFEVFGKGFLRVFFSQFK